MYRKEDLIELKKALGLNMKKISGSSVLTGFDGYVDKLVRLQKSQGVNAEYYETICEFVQHIARHNYESADTEMNCIAEKVGGNGTLLAQAVAEKGVNTTCIGAMGYPKLHPVYQELAEKCSLLSVEEPASTLAMEFQNGKLMFGDAAPLNRIDWKHIRTGIGLNRLRALFEQADLFAFANWSGMLHSNDILEGIIEEICPDLTKRQRHVFFDLADPSAKSEEQFSVLFQNIGKMQSCYRVILGLNPKEGLFVFNRCFHADEENLTIDMEDELRRKLPVNELVIHALDYADVGTSISPMQRVPGERFQNPIIVTGGGDNFNSGYCIGKLMGLDAKNCGLLGNLSSLIFVSTGRPAGMRDILECINSKL